MARSVRIPKHVVSESVGDETVLLDTQAGQFFSLNPTAARLFEILRSTGDPAIAQAKLLGEYAVDPNTLAQDVDDLLDALSRRGLICVVDEPPDDPT